LSSSPNLITVIPKLACLNSAETKHLPVIWDQGKAAAKSTVIAVPEHKKLKDIKYLHPFENKVRSLCSAKSCSPKVYHRLTLFTLITLFTEEGMACHRKGAQD
jgi:hypothetical protein